MRLQSGVQNFHLNIEIKITPETTARAPIAILYVIFSVFKKILLEISMNNGLVPCIGDTIVTFPMVSAEKEQIQAIQMLNPEPKK